MGIVEFLTGWGLVAFLVFLFFYAVHKNNEEEEKDQQRRMKDG